jgi:ribosomal protein L29
MKYNIAGIQTDVKFKSVEELRAMNPQELRSRLRDVSVTLAALRKSKKMGMGNPRVYHKAKVEKKLIIKILNEKDPGRVE